MNIFTEGKHEKKITSIISVSNVHAIDEIARIANISESDTVRLIEKMIRRSTGTYYVLYRNAHIDYSNNVIVLDETRNKSITDKFSKMTVSLLEKFTPKEPIKIVEWKCSYCGGMNAPDHFECSKCGASKE